MSNYAAIQLAKLRPEGNGYGYSEQWQRGDWTIEHHSSVSEAGVAQLRMVAAIHEAHVDVLDTWMSVYGLTQCEHGRPLTDLEWSVCDYYFELMEEPEKAWFVLSGWHPDGDAFCLAQCYRVVGSGGVFLTEPWPEGAG